MSPDFPGQERKELSSDAAGWVLLGFIALIVFGSVMTVCGVQP